MVGSESRACFQKLRITFALSWHMFRELSVLLLPTCPRKWLTVRIIRLLISSEKSFPISRQNSKSSQGKCELMQSRKRRPIDVQSDTLQRCPPLVPNCQSHLVMQRSGAHKVQEDEEVEFERLTRAFNTSRLLLRLHQHPRQSLRVFEVKNRSISHRFCRLMIKCTFGEGEF